MNSDLKSVTMKRTLPHSTKLDHAGEGTITNEIILPSPRLKPFIQHYDWYEILTDKADLRLSFFPNFTVGLLFIFYENEKIFVYNSKFGQGLLPKIFMVPPTSIPTFNHGF